MVWAETDGEARCQGRVITRSSAGCLLRGEERGKDAQHAEHHPNLQRVYRLGYETWAKTDRQPFCRTQYHRSCASCLHDRMMQRGWSVESVLSQLIYVCSDLAQVSS